MLDVYVLSPNGIACMERPKGIGRISGVLPGPTDFGDTFDAIRVSADGTRPDGYLLTGGNVLEFDYMIPVPETGNVAPPLRPTETWTDDVSRSTAKYGFDLKFWAGPWLSDRAAIDSESGLEVAYSDKITLADGEWHHARVDLAEFEGMTLEQFIIAIDEDTVHRFVVFVAGVLITDGFNVVPRHVIWNGDDADTSTTNFADSLNVGSIAPISDRILERGLMGPLIVFGSITGDTISGGFISPQYIVTSGTTYTVGTSDSSVLNNSTTGNMTFTLPAASSVEAGRRFTFVNLRGDHNLTIARAGSDLINGATTLALNAQYAKATLEGDHGSAWTQVA